MYVNNNVCRELKFEDFVFYFIAFVYPVWSKTHAMYMIDIWMDISLNVVEIEMLFKELTQEIFIPSSFINGWLNRQVYCNT